MLYSRVHEIKVQSSYDYDYEKYESVVMEDAIVLLNVKEKINIKLIERSKVLINLLKIIHD